jgi:hypothetical protein
VPGVVSVTVKVELVFGIMSGGEFGTFAPDGWDVQWTSCGAPD